MPRRFLILEHSGKAPSWLPILGAQANCEIKEWESFFPQALDPRIHLILAHAAPEMGKTMFFFEWLRKNPIRTPVLAILPELPDDGVLREVSQVVDDFLLCPLREEELNLRITRILGTQSGLNEQLRDALEDELGLSQVVGKHPSFRKAVQQVRPFSASEASVLITGETGTGKELFAHAIHSLSRLRNGPFIPVDCGALPEHLAENELFGHRRGAFTDAHSDQKGLAGMAEGGTLFLDEIDSLSLSNQAKMLRFLQERSYRALGADRFTQANVRVIAATNRCIEEAVHHKEFRSDLYFRLSVLRLNLPALRERHGDVSLLAQHFLENECAGQCRVLSAAALGKLENHQWPGNVRELLNVLQRAFVCSPGRQILPEHIALDGETLNQKNTAVFSGNLRTAKQQMIEQFERRYIEDLLARHEGNVTRAAREAGKERRAFGRLVKKYSIMGHGLGSAPGAGHF